MYPTRLSFLDQKSSLSLSDKPLPTLTRMVRLSSTPSHTRAPKRPAFLPVPSSMSITSKSTVITGFHFIQNVLRLHSYGASSFLIIMPSNPLLTHSLAYSDIFICPTGVFKSNCLPLTITTCLSCTLLTTDSNANNLSICVLLLCPSLNSANDNISNTLNTLSVAV